MLPIQLAHAAPGDHLWSKGWSVQGTGATVDEAGNTYIAGTFNGTVDFGGGPLSSISGVDVFVAKFGPDGSHLWSSNYTPTNFIQVTALAAQPSGGVYVAGILPKGGEIDFGGGPLGDAQNNLWAVKFASNGVHEWSDEYGRGVILDIDATNTHVAFAARNSSTVDFGGGPIGAGLGSQAVAAKLTSAGDHEWSRGFGDSGFQSGLDVGLQTGGELVLLSTIRGTADFGGGGLTADANEDLAFAKFDAGGTHLWSHLTHGTFGSSTILNTGLDVNGAGDIAVTGEFFGTVDFGAGSLSANGGDVFLVQFSASGSVSRSQAFAASGDQTGFSVRFDGSGIILAGMYKSPVSFGGGDLPPFGSQDLFVASLETSGTHRWSRGFGTTASDARCEADVDGQGSVILGALAASGVSFGGDPIAGTFHIAKLEGEDAPLATFAPGVSRPNVLAGTPNPFAASTLLRLDGVEGARSLAIFDAAGRRIRSFESLAGKSVIAWDGSAEGGGAVAPGVYWAELTTRTGIVRTRLVRVN